MTTNNYRVFHKSTDFRCSVFIMAMEMPFIHFVLYWTIQKIIFYFFISFEAAASQPIETIPEEPEHHHVPEETHSALVPDKGKKPQSEVQRLIEKWNIPPLAEEPHFHCKENCKHCKEEIFHGEEVSAPHVTRKIKRVSTVDWKTVGSKWNLFVWTVNRNSNMKFCLIDHH